MTGQDARRRARGRPRTVEPEAPGTTVQALDRAVMLLRALAREGKATLTDLAAITGMPASSAHRLLATLETHGLVEFSDTTQDWMIGVESFRIGTAFVQRSNLVDASREVMRRLVDETGETANLAIADEGEVVFLAQVDTQNPIRAFFRAGTRVHMHSSGIGKALLAFFDRARCDAVVKRRGLPGFTARTLTDPVALTADLDRTRARGWSLDDEERFDGMRCIAAPIFNTYGEPVAGVSISGPAVRFGDSALATLGARVRAAADEITRLTGGTPPAVRG
ncbi:IclR family transcriptional regulator [Limibaculum sp. FT325]|uniref:HTH-type transcriptional regulator BhcR n=1 Tax=Thermohalobaculum sediminis TaxID=2939436 RepID=UPI0020BF77BF|nr:HTH-type transcriptional regulator BhcR [Limibaculum sediminis]MCL5776540.1 IclR family transcriptional regulator [Limibaculum sediminis]